MALLHTRRSSPPSERLPHKGLLMLPSRRGRTLSLIPRQDSTTTSPHLHGLTTPLCFRRGHNMVTLRRHALPTFPLHHLDRWTTPPPSHSLSFKTLWGCGLPRLIPPSTPSILTQPRRSHSRHTTPRQRHRCQCPEHPQRFPVSHHRGYCSLRGLRLKGQRPHHHHRHRKPPP